MAAFDRWVTKAADMCHLILFLPIVALPLLWLLPFGVSVPLYAVAVVLALWAYWMALKAMRAPVTTGAEALLHTTGTVRSVDRRLATISLGGELWFAEPPADVLKVGDCVEVIGMEGLRLKVKRIAGSSDGHPNSPTHGHPNSST